MKTRTLNLKYSLGIGILAGLCAFAIWLSGLLQEGEETLVDIYARLLKKSYSSAIVTVLIQSPGENGWPISRLDYTLALRAISPFAPKVVGFEPSLEGMDTLYSNYDLQLASTIQQMGSIVLSAPARKGEGTLPPADASSLQGETLSLPIYSNVLWPSAKLGGLVGITHIPIDPTGVVRHLPLVFNAGDKIYPSWTLVLLAKLLHADLTKSIYKAGDGLWLYNEEEKFLRYIPLDSKGQLRFFYTKNFPPSVDFWTVIQAREEMLQDKEPVYSLRSFHDQTILIGRANPEIVDALPTPIGPLFPVQIEAQALASLLEGGYLKESGKVVVFCILLLGGLMGALAARVLKVSRIVSILGSVIFIPVVAVGMGIIVAPIALPLACALAYGSSKFWIKKF